MRARVVKHGGELTVSGRPGEGTSISMAVPLRQTSIIGRFFN
jgi:signal transduction histidine kinase